jgi:hypothetical protein
MNPFRWKRERQVALMLAIGLGFFVGFIAGRAFIEPYGHYIRYANKYRGYIGTYWLLVTIWGTIGGAIGAVIVLIVQLAAFLSSSRYDEDDIQKVANL